MSTHTSTEGSGIRLYVIEHTARQLVERLESCLQADPLTAAEAVANAYLIIAYLDHLVSGGAPAEDRDEYRGQMHALTSCIVALSYSAAAEVRQHAGFAAIHAAHLGAFIRELAGHA